MKNKFGYIILIAVLVLMAVACFAACDGGDPVYGAWEHNEGKHWRTVDGVKQESNHVFDAGVCECGFEVKFTEWAYDETTHWHPAKFGGVDEKYGATSHKITNNMCTCGYGVRLTYKLAVDSYTVTGFEGELPDGIAITVPETYNGLPVKAIASSAFSGNKQLGSLTAPANIRHIAAEAFAGCTSLKSVTYGDGVNVVETAAFADCPELTAVNLGENVREIRDYAFENCPKLTTVGNTPKLTEIGFQAFAGCTALTSFNLGEATEVPDSAFVNCVSLANLTMSEKATSIGAQAFMNCKALTEIELSDGLTYVGMSAFRDSGLTSVTLPDSVTRLASHAFSGCKDLVSAVLSANLDYAIDEWFSGCDKLASLTLPFVGSEGGSGEKVANKHLGYAFGTTARSEEAYDKIFKSGDAEAYAVYYYVPKTLTTVTILGGSVTGASFENCEHVTEIKLGSSVTGFGGEFVDCNATVTVLDESPSDNSSQE